MNKKCGFVQVARCGGIIALGAHWAGTVLDMIELQYERTQGHCSSGLNNKSWHSGHTVCDMEAHDI